MPATVSTTRRIFEFGHARRKRHRQDNDKDEPLAKRNRETPDIVATDVVGMVIVVAIVAVIAVAVLSVVAGYLAVSHEGDTVSATVTDTTD